nr:9151_t:CDS:2 [Entrophospora candida]
MDPEKEEFDEENTEEYAEMFEENLEKLEELKIFECEDSIEIFNWANPWRNKNEIAPGVNTKNLTFKKRSEIETQKIWNRDNEIRFGNNQNNHRKPEFIRGTIISRPGQPPIMTREVIGKREQNAPTYTPEPKEGERREEYTPVDTPTETPNTTDNERETRRIYNKNANRNKFSKRKFSRKGKKDRIKEKGINYTNKKDSGYDTLSGYKETARINPFNNRRQGSGRTISAVRPTTATVTTTGRNNTGGRITLISRLYQSGERGNSFTAIGKIGNTEIKIIFNMEREYDVISNATLAQRIGGGNHNLRTEDQALVTSGLPEELSNNRRITQKKSDDSVCIEFEYFIILCKKIFINSSTTNSNYISIGLKTIKQNGIEFNFSKNQFSIPNPEYEPNQQKPRLYANNIYKRSDYGNRPLQLSELQDSNDDSDYSEEIEMLNEEIDNEIVMENVEEREKREIEKEIKEGRMMLDLIDSSTWLMEKYDYQVRRVDFNSKEKSNIFYYGTVKEDLLDERIIKAQPKELLKTYYWKEEYLERTVEKITKYYKIGNKKEEEICEKFNNNNNEKFNTKIYPFTKEDLKLQEEFEERIEKQPELFKEIYFMKGKTREEKKYEKYKGTFKENGIRIVLYEIEDERYAEKYTKRKEKQNNNWINWYDKKQIMEKEDKDRIGICYRRKYPHQGKDNPENKIQILEYWKEYYHPEQEETDQEKIKIKEKLFEEIYKKGYKPKWYKERKDQYKEQSIWKNTMKNADNKIIEIINQEETMNEKIIDYNYDDYESDEEMFMLEETPRVDEKLERMESEEKHKGKSFVIIILWDDEGTWISRRENMNKVYYGLYQYPGGGKEDRQFKNLPEIKELKELLLKYKGIFAVSEEDMEQIPREIAEFSIPLKEGMQPKDMDINPEEKKDIKIQESLKKWLTNQMKAGYIQKVEKGGIVERVEFACNLITVEKKGKDELRHCQNMTRLNECTIDRSQRIGFLEMQLKNAVGYKYYSTMDIRMGFNNIGIKPEDIYKTAFKCIYGIYVQLVMGFGYKDAPTEFQETMERIFKEIIFEDWISIYMDDILVKTNSTKEMLQNLEKVFRLMVKGKIKADPSKCEFMKKEVKILGKLVSEKGMRIPDAYLKALEDWKWPEGLESYNGRITWMMDFVQDAQEDMSIIRRVINEEKTGPVDYKEPKEAFERLKEKIRKRVILGKADYTKIMKLSCDASDNALGAVLYQDKEENDEKGRKITRKEILGFYSRSFNNLQKGYSIPRKELMAINEGIEHFYADLRISKEVQILTDSAIAYKLHKNITKGKITKSPKFLPLLIEHIELPKQIIWISRDKNKWSDLMTRIGQEDKKKFENEQIDKIINKEKLEIYQVQDTELYPGGKKIENPGQKEKKRKMMRKEEDIAKSNMNNFIKEKEKEINNNNKIREEYNKLRKEIIEQNTEEIKEEFEKLIRLNREIREKMEQTNQNQEFGQDVQESQQIMFQPEEYEEMKKNLEKYKLMMKQIEKEEKEKEIAQKKEIFQKKKKELKEVGQQILELTDQQDRLIYELRKLENEITGADLKRGKEKQEVRGETSRRELSPGQIWTKRYEEENQIVIDNTYRESRRPIKYGDNRPRNEERIDNYWKERKGTFGCSNCGETTHAYANCPKVRCGECGELGHIKKFCKNKKCDKCGESGHIRKDCQNYSTKEIMIARKESERNHETKFTPAEN